MSEQKSLPGTSNTQDTSSETVENGTSTDVLTDLDRARAKRALILLVILLCGALIIWSSYSAKVNDTALRPGVYIGGVSAGNLATFDIFAEKEPNSETVKIVPFSPDWPAQEVHSDELKDVPLSLRSPSLHIELVIANASENEFSGQVYLSGTKERIGTWNLRSVETLKFSKQSDIELAGIKRAIGHFTEESQILSDIKKSQDQIASLRAQVREGGVGPTKAQLDELEALTQELSLHEKKVSELSESLAQANNRLNVELKVSKAGKLVQLAREAEAREERWRNSLYKTDPESLEPELFSKLQDAKRISDLRILIAAEQIRVFGGTKRDQQ